MFCLTTLLTVDIHNKTELYVPIAIHFLHANKRNHDRNKAHTPSK